MEDCVTDGVGPLDDEDVDMHAAKTPVAARATIVGTTARARDTDAMRVSCEGAVECSPT
jgi:hypothetical protein